MTVAAEAACYNANETALWVLSERKRRTMNQSQDEQAAKVGKRSNAYRCAREGCPVEATAQAALKKCDGPCPEELKPSYCSEDCQKAVSSRSVLRVGLLPLWYDRIGGSINMTASLKWSPCPARNALRMLYSVQVLTHLSTKA